MGMSAATSAAGRRGEAVADGDVERRLVLVVAAGGGARVRREKRSHHAHVVVRLRIGAGPCTHACTPCTVRVRAACVCVCVCVRGVRVRVRVRVRARARARARVCVVASACAARWSEHLGARLVSGRLRPRAAAAALVFRRSRAQAWWRGLQAGGGWQVGGRHGRGRVRDGRRWCSSATCSGSRSSSPQASLMAAGCALSSARSTDLDAKDCTAAQRQAAVGVAARTRPATRGAAGAPYPGRLG